MELFKRLTKIKNTKDVSPKKSKTSPDDDVEKKLTYFQSGYGASKGAMGNPTILKNALAGVFEDYKERARKNNERQDELKKPHVEKLKKVETEKNKKETAKSLKEDRIESIDTGVDKLEFEISDVPSNPTKYGVDADKKPKAQFFIGLFILIPLSIYLMVFYISASYSAFFKQFLDSDVMTAIFDGNSFSKAMNEGWLEAMFVILLPFVFMGLGYLIHMFQKEKRTIGIIKVVGILAITFIFDALLAFQIEKKIYDFEKTLTSPDFNFKIAFSKPEFWTIIFAGFLVYVIWGLVFDFVMKEYENFDKIKSFIRSHQENRKNLLSKKEKLRDEVSDIDNQLAEINGKMKEIQSVIDGFIFEEKKYLKFHTEFLDGWLMAISKEISLPHKEKDDLISACEEVNRNHLDDLGFVTKTNENLIYTQ